MKKKFVKENNKKESESTLMKFNKIKRTSNSDGREAVEIPAGPNNENISSETKPRPPRPECVRCARSWATKAELQMHTNLARTMGWRVAGCSASGKVSVKRKTPGDENNNIALPRKRLKVKGTMKK